MAFLALAMGVCASAQITIKFSDTDKANAGTLDGKVFENDGMELTITDKVDGGKVSIDANSCRFGELGKSDAYTHRIKTGGKSDSKNNMKLYVPEDGTLYIAVRTASKDAARAVILTQNDVVLLNQKVIDSDAKEETYTKEDNSEGIRNIFPYIKCNVKAGNVNITYTDGGVNFYAFILDTDGSTPIKSINADSLPAGKSVKTIEDGKVIIIRDGVKYNMNGSIIK